MALNHTVAEEAGERDTMTASRATVKEGTGDRLAGAVARCAAKLFWTPDSAVNLAVVRIALCAYLFVDAAWSAFNSNELSDSPPIPPDLLGDLLVALPRGSSTLQLVAAGLAVSCALGAVGWKTRWAMVGVVVLGAYHLGVPQIFGKVDHNHHLLWVAVILALFPCGDALALDSHGRVPPRSIRYGFPLRVIWLLLGLTYFFPGAWKIAGVGFEWASAENMARLIWRERFAAGGYVPIVDIVSLPPALIVGGAMTMLIEVCFIFLVFSDRTRPFAVVAGLGFHLGVGLTMGIWFTSLGLLYVAFVDWDRLLSRLRGADITAPSHDDPSGIHLAPVLLSIALVCCVFFAGIGRIIDGWPVASYPDFAYKPGSTLVDFELRGSGEVAYGEALPGLSRIEAQRLLSRATTSAKARSSLSNTIRSGPLCHTHPDSEITILRREWSVGVGDAQPVGTTEVTVISCPE